MQLRTNVSSLQGIIHVPGDKSISHRAVMLGAIAHGTTTIENFLPGEDCLSTIDCFRKMGVVIKQDGSHVVVEGKGQGGLQEPSDILHVGNSGTTARLLLGILAGCPFHACLIGDESIAKRPMGRVTKPLKMMGARIDGREHGNYTPISIRGGELQPIHYESPVASAQVKSAILLAGLATDGTTAVTEPNRSRDHTERMIRLFGGNVAVDGLTVAVTGPQQLAGTSIYVPGDISSAAFFLVAGAVVPNSEITLKNVGLNPTRTGIIDVLQKMGADITIANVRNEQTEPFGDITVRTSRLAATEISGELIPRLIDEIPIIALLATQAEGTTVIKDASELKVKETNRIDTVVTELRKLGAEIEATEDGMIIHGKSALKAEKAVVDSHGDHRIGMMLAIAACITKGAVHLKRPEAVAVSYPAFFDHLHSLI
ncbi:3-phosphoshikimate 1-carboxyvinyltransferase [Saccharococcus caldoxylosilyticus]|uniref:3-phosphoshikimate 1-carboxyvinyltransferase n=1 Tax=Parageobacillus caldoxylosilyticus NBRC 107762 TaxID=1220594 RepID=A0A023DG04_9BACL|nr:3-phosphoshikimate 1-carboxyvinyltransferase [Parageobacillus caldoxylosilyticus]MBB3853450.1 3-phosphoshikimate 1-carboxyvinyltransferase [Parageobacillus caldoxylosilyticus]GAJ40197.1 3-phosphoshikimate 1-carboxyvinyltransferase [Parageobacillus caldoxylosilyticus NBRC 107762]